MIDATSPSTPIIRTAKNAQEVPCPGCGRTGLKSCKRGLCFCCYLVAADEGTLPESFGHGHRGEAGEDVLELPLAPTPTTETPGSRGKIAVMAERVAAGFAALHPDDAQRDDREGVDDLAYRQFMTRQA